MIYLVSLFCCLPSSVTMASVNESTTDTNFNSTNSGIDLTANYLNSMHHKIETTANVLAGIDSAIKDLQEKAHTSAIFRHHIESWNSQMKSFEQKIDLIKRTQDEYSVCEVKLTNLEFTLNHVLTKVMQLNDNSNVQIEVFNKNLESLINERFGEIYRFIVADKRRRTDILRHVQYLSRSSSNLEEHKPKVASRLMQCNNISQQRSSDNVAANLEIIVKMIKEKISQLFQNFIQKDLKILAAIGKKNIKISDDILNSVKMANEFNSQTKSSCQSITNVLERFENVMNTIAAVHEKYNNITELVSGTESTDEEVNVDQLNFIHPTKKSCHELDGGQRIDGIYKFSQPELNEAGRDFNERLCVFATEGKAWTVIQNRGPYNVQENFNRSWNEYRDGFGNLNEEFWFGNEYIHQLVWSVNYELRIEMEDFEGGRVWVEYSIFRIDSEEYNYNLLIGGYRGIVEDSMRYHNEIDFSTYDRRNDRSVDACCACALGYASGWWFDNCSEANLNGLFHESPLGHNYVGIIWEYWHGDYSLKKTKMMIRPKIWTNGNEDP